MQDLHIKFNSIIELNNIVLILEKSGLKNTFGNPIFYGFETTVVSIDCIGKGFKILNKPIVDRVNLTYQQFMKKYGMPNLKSKVEEAKKTLGLNNHELSLKLGHQKRYITNALLDPSVKRHKNIILKIDALLLKESGELTNDFEGDLSNKTIDDAIMVGKDEYDEMYSKNTALCVEVGQLKKEIDHKTQIAEKHADMRNKAELRVSELERECGEKDTAIKQQLLNSGNQVCKINELENQIQSLREKLIQSEQDSEKWQCDYWAVSRENIELENSKRHISIWLAVSILIIVVMLGFGVLHFNGVV